MKTLYKLDSKGKVRSWQIEVKFSGYYPKIITTAGLLEGGKTVTEVVITTGKNIGRTNETTALQQAEFEAQATWNLKVRSGYVEDITQVRQAVLGSGIPAPMLAQKYSPNGEQKSSKTLVQMKLAGQKIHVQPKLDGNRCLIKINSDGVEMFTRKGDRMLPLPHIEEQILSCYEHILKSDKTFILDGELYTTEFSFNTLNGLIRREEKTDEHLEMLRQVNYHIYDVMAGDLCYAERLCLIGQFRHTNIKLIPSFEIIASDTEIRKVMELFLADGYEGLMIRRLDTPYQNKRSWSLMKYKDFQDAEYKVVDIIEDARGGGIIGAFVLEMNEPAVDRDGREIKTFRAGIKDLSQDEGRKMLANKQDFIGRYATVEFFSLSEYSVPRFGKLKGFRADI